MCTNIKVEGNKIERIYMKEKYYKSYSQTGEDMIIRFFFSVLGIDHPSYIDVGAHDPFYLSNTAYLYNTGSKGINIDANPECIRKFIRYRKRDINLNVGIDGADMEELDFYVMNPATMSTFSKEQAESLVKEHDMKIEKIKKIQVCTISSIIDKYCNGIFPDFLSLDAEGKDLDILKTIEFEKSNPKLICCETIGYKNGLRELEKRRENDIVDFLRGKEYSIVAETCINTIFIRNEYIN